MWVQMNDKYMKRLSFFSFLSTALLPNMCVTCEGAALCASPSLSDLYCNNGVTDLCTEDYCGCSTDSPTLFPTLSTTLPKLIGVFALGETFYFPMEHH